jgi:hypothetical protein
MPYASDGNGMLLRSEVLKQRMINLYMGKEAVEKFDRMHLFNYACCTCFDFYSWEAHLFLVGTKSGEIFFCSKVLSTSHHVMSRHIISCHVPSNHALSRHIASYHVTSCHVTSNHVMSRHIASYHVTSRHVTSSCITSEHITFLFPTGLQTQRSERDGVSPHVPLGHILFI